MTNIRKEVRRGKVAGAGLGARASRAPRLGVRRRIIRRRKIALGFILTTFIFIFTIVMLRQPFMKITRIAVVAPAGISDAVVSSIAWHSLDGSYVNIIPYSSLLFFNSGAVRNAVLKSEPTVAAVSISRKGLSSISIALEPRTALSRWCGISASSTPANTLLKDTDVAKRCYLFDSSGFLYRNIAKSALPSASSSLVGKLSQSIAIGSTTALFPYTVYAPLTATGTPYLNTIANESLLPHIFDFAQNIRTFHATVSAIVLRGDEVDLFLNDGTRITYVRGGERNAFSLLSSVAKNISLSDGSLQYVDLRFKDKVYFKRR
ncbi:MAG TPA: hypothetical protein ENI56_01780 [Candidatus Kaiserbacteria bacterium]|nr:hypothetical protein [Candidatus Kaiserbacteria bacterium]